MSTQEVSAGKSAEMVGGSMAAVFAEMCGKHGERVALTLEGAAMTYAELDALANGVASALVERGVTPGQIVALYLDRSFALIAAMLGVWKAGCAYLPVEVNSPASRTQHIFKDSKAAAVVTTASFAGGLTEFGVAAVLVEDVVPCEAAGQVANIVRSDELAYVIYTSGSTGKPKGVMVSHENLRRLLTQTEAWFAFSEHDVWTMFHSCAFDFSVWEIWGCLMYGGRLVIVPYQTSRSPEDFYSLLADERVTVLNQTPTALTLLLAAEGRVARREIALRLVILGGEALQLTSLLPLFERHGAAAPAVVNMYGITETTVHVTARVIREEDARGAVDSLIGEPIADLEIHLLDAELKPVAAGETGEICVTGAGVALGYLNQPELTAARFVANPFGDGRMYRSGDLGRMRADGELVYLGRSDNQVKVSGFRIELGEVEAVLAATPGVAQVCVMAVQDAVAGTRLVAYVAGSVSQAAVVEYAGQHLAAYMRPSRYVMLDKMPINANGKVDRAALVAYEVPVSAVVSLLSATEAKVASAWSAVLGYDVADAAMNFFDAGGNSLLVVSLRQRLQDEFGVAIPITWMFEDTTIQSFAKRMDMKSVEAVVPVIAGSRAQQQREAFARMRQGREVSR